MHGSDRFTQLINEVSRVVGLPDARHLLKTRTLSVDGFDVMLDHFETDPDALYVQFNFGAVAAGRTLVVFRLLLEANVLIYAQDQAQTGLDTDTGSVLLFVRVVMTQDLDGEVLADLLAHYAEHGRYWRRNIIESTDEMFEGIATGQWVWLRA